MNAIVYIRISHDPEGTRVGVERQLKECRTHIERAGWECVDTFEDNDRSASKGNPRPGWEQATDRIRVGDIDVLVAWANDRLTRHPRELEDLVDLLERTKTRVETVTSGTFDLSTPEGRTQARIVGALARQESERASERLAAANRDAAYRGKRMGGRRPFGYEADGTIREDEAAELRDMARKVIDGHSTRSIRMDLNERGVLTAAGGQWTYGRIAEILKNPRYIGKRTYKGEVVADAEWPPIFDLSTWQKLQAKLSRPERRWNGGDMKRWMTRVAICGRCQQPLVSGQVSRERGPSYTCSTDSGCNRLAIKAAWLEQYVEGLIIDALSAPSAQERFAAPEVDEQALATIDEQLDELSVKLDEADRDYDDPDVDFDRSRWLRRSQRLTATMRKLESERDKLLRSSAVANVPETDLSTWWSNLDARQKRNVAWLLFQNVTVNPSRNLGGKPDWDRIVVSWAA